MPGSLEKQKTIARTLMLVGPGRWARKSRVSLYPAPVDSGIAFYHARRLVILSPNTVRIREHTVGCNGIWVVEHLLATLNALGVDNVVLESKNGEIPFFDGSAKEFAGALFSNLITQDAARNTIQPRTEIRVESGNSWLTLRPAERLGIEVLLTNDVLIKQRLSFGVTGKLYVKHIAPARTFVVTREQDPRLKHMPGYGFAVTPSGTFSREESRFPDEPVRHKILDLLGDLAVAGRAVRGQITGHNIGHRLNHALVRAIVRTERASTL